MALLSPRSSPARRGFALTGAPAARANGSPDARLLIVTADDFGLSPQVNEAVEIAHRTGILSAASLMVGAPAAADAVARARRLPGLRVGLHLALVEAAPVLPQRQIPDLVGADGRLRNDMVRLSLRLLRSAHARRQLAAEIEAQFEAYAATGLALDHVNAHKHFHLNPLVSGLVLEIGRRCGMRAVRVPREPRSVLRRIEPGTGGGFDPEALLARRLASLARRHTLATCDQVFGLKWTGAMSCERTAKLIEALPPGPSEIYFHPATDAGFEGAAPGYGYREEFEALTSPMVVGTTRAAGVRLGGYGDIDALA